MAKDKPELIIGLAGNSNVGKSVFFHQITGVPVRVSNYPGTTVEITKGKVKHEDKKIELIDLPGTYSLKGVSEDQKVARRVILEKADVIINILDAANLERNLYLTLQLLELDVPMVVVLNQYDRAEKEGIRIDPEIISEELGVPVFRTVATQGKNIYKAFKKAIEIGLENKKPKEEIKMCKGLEKKIEELTASIEENLDPIPLGLPPRTLAINLLEGDEELIQVVRKSDKGKKVIEKLNAVSKEIKESSEEEPNVRIAKERHGIASLIADEASEYEESKESVVEKIDRFTTRLETGVPLMILTFLGLLGVLFFVGGAIEELVIGGWENYVAPTLNSFLQAVSPNPIISRVLRIGINQGLKGILAVMVPYLPPFFLALAILEDTGYLPRIAMIMDSLMHKIGLHGKAVFPMLGGFGCNVPAIMTTRTLTDRRQRVIAGTLITMIPCSARTAVILGTVGAFLGILPAFAIYGIVLSLIFLVGLVLNKFLPGETPGMVLEIPPLRKPGLKPVLAKTWYRLKSFLFIATPLLLVGSLLIGALDALGIMNQIVKPLSPLTTGLLGLPAVVILPLLYGIIRKEGALALLTTVAGTSNLTNFMSPLQLFIFALVTTIYIPCIATFAVLKRELGWKEAILIPLFTISLAIGVGSAFYYLNPLGL